MAGLRRVRGTIVRTWLYQIATNRCLTELAEQSRRVLPSGLSDPEPDPRARPEEAGPQVSWLQPAPDAMVIPESADPAPPAPPASESPAHPGRDHGGVRDIP